MSENPTANYAIVYVLVNPAMPGLVKIGRTAAHDTAIRLAQLYTTGVPVPFELKFACRVQNPDEVELALHTAFGPQRINPRREFFRIDPEQAIAILRLLHTEDATAEVAAQPTGIDPQSLAAAEVLRTRRPSLNYYEMGIPEGSILVCPENGATVTVVGPKKVLLGETEMSLTAATRQVLQLDYNVQPTPYWTFQGRSLQEIYEETYADVE
ncbi:MAG: GIY-YIG nuclease family protein [Pirellulales bacterium]|nr:GIY-YIG nuclease family protein [Pirellulales bacterium]